MQKPSNAMWKELSNFGSWVVMSLGSFKSLNMRFTYRSQWEDQSGNWDTTNVTKCKKCEWFGELREEGEWQREWDFSWTWEVGTLAPRRQEGSVWGQGKGPGQRREGRKNHMQLRDDARKQMTSNGGGASDKNLSPQHKGPCVSECGAERPLKLQRQVTV